MLRVVRKAGELMWRFARTEQTQPGAVKRPALRKIAGAVAFIGVAVGFRTQLSADYCYGIPSGYCGAWCEFMVCEEHPWKEHYYCHDVPPGSGCVDKGWACGVC